MPESNNQSLKPDDPGFFTVENISSCLGPDLLSETTCRRIALDFLYSGYPRCPLCGHALKEKQYQGFYENKRINCLYCGKQFNAKTGTPFSGVHATWREMVFLCILGGLGFDSTRIAERMRFSSDWVYEWGCKIGLWQKPEKPMMIIKSPEQLIEGFLMDCTEKDPQAETPATALYRAYCRWAEDKPGAVMTQKRFGGLLRKQGLKRAKSGTYRYLRIRLVNDDEKNTIRISDGNHGKISRKTM